MDEKEAKALVETIRRPEFKTVNNGEKQMVELIKWLDGKWRESKATLAEVDRRAAGVEAKVTSMKKLIEDEIETRKRETKRATAAEQKLAVMTCTEHRMPIYGGKCWQDVLMEAERYRIESDSWRADCKRLSEKLGLAEGKVDDMSTEYGCTCVLGDRPGDPLRAQYDVPSACKLHAEGWKRATQLFPEQEHVHDGSPCKACGDPYNPGNRLPAKCPHCGFVCPVIAAGMWDHEEDAHYHHQPDCPYNVISRYFKMTTRVEDKTKPCWLCQGMKNVFPVYNTHNIIVVGGCVVLGGLGHEECRPCPVCQNRESETKLLEDVQQLEKVVAERTTERNDLKFKVEGLELERKSFLKDADAVKRHLEIVASWRAAVESLNVEVGRLTDANARSVGIACTFESELDRTKRRAEEAVKNTEETCARMKTQTARITLLEQEIARLSDVCEDIEAERALNNALLKAPRFKTEKAYAKWKKTIEPLKTKVLQSRAAESLAPRVKWTTYNGMKRMTRPCPSTHDVCDGIVLCEHCGQWTRHLWGSEHCTTCEAPEVTVTVPIGGDKLTMVNEKYLNKCWVCGGPADACTGCLSRVRIKDETALKLAKVALEEGGHQNSLAAVVVREALEQRGAKRGGQDG